MFKKWILMGLCMPVLGFADAWHAALEVQEVYLTFKPRYISTVDQASSRFTDPSSGQGVALSADYTWDLPHSFGVAVQAMASYDNAEWHLTTDEPADLTYGMPWRYGASVLPEYRFNNKWAGFIELGIEQGRVEQEKESDTASTYNHSQWVTGGTVGGGLRYDANDRVGMFVSYRYTQFQSYQFFSQLANDAVPEIIQDSPYSSIVSLGIIAKLG